MEKLKAILIDDELSSLNNLNKKLTEFCPEVSVIATTQIPEEGLKLISIHRPDVVFLDIEMPRMNGFRMLEELKEPDFAIIFTTAYNHYAIDAIRISAFDYLTKPIAIKDLQNAIERLQYHNNNFTKEKMDVLKQTFNDTKTQDDKIAISTSESVEFVPISSIIRIESSSNYSRIIFDDGRITLVSKLLKDFETVLVPYKFFRIHHSHLINLKHLKKYLRSDGGQVMMQNGDLIDISRRKKEEFMQLISV